MSRNNNTVRFRVKWRGGQLQLLDGGPIKLKEGTTGELCVDPECFTDAGSLEALTTQRKVLLLPAGTELRVALTIRPDLPKTLHRFLLATAHDPPTTSISIQSRFVGIRLLGPTAAQRLGKSRPGGLWLSFIGKEFSGVKSGTVDLPRTHGLQSVDSLNQAFTRLSEVFEPWRKAHTGNIYERIYYQERNNRWYPLNDLRDRSLATDTRPMVQKLWARVGN
jgi:hypothetical protein